MERAQAQVIGTPFLEFYIGTYDVNNINATLYLLYGMLADQTVYIVECNNFQN